MTTDFTITMDGEPIGTIAVNDEFGVSIDVAYPPLKTIVVDYLTTERTDRDGSAEADACYDEQVTDIPVDNPFSLQMALLGLSNVISPLYPDDTKIDVDGDWTVFLKEGAEDAG